MEDEVQIIDKKNTGSGVRIIYVIGVAVSALLVGVLLGYGLYYYMSLRNQQQDGTVYPTSTPTISVVTETLPTGWTYIKSNSCPISFAIPPKESPYVVVNSGKYWKFINDPSLSADFITYFAGKKGMSYRTSAYFLEDDSATDAPVPLVAVECMEYTAKPTKDELKAIVTKALADYKAKETTADSAVTISNIVIASRWGKDVIDFSITYKYVEMGTFITNQTAVVHNSKMIIITDGKTDIDGAFVSQIQQEIFQKLKFD